MLYAAAVAGETGVSHAIRLLRDEVDRDMAMLGTNTIGEVTRAHLMDARSFDGLF
jgi:L-lactate dehydrogenase (cytochrome)